MEQYTLLNSLGLFSQPISAPFNRDVHQQPVTSIEKKADCQLTQEFIECAIDQLENMAQLQLGNAPSRVLYLNQLKTLLLQSTAELDDLISPHIKPHCALAA